MKFVDGLLLGDLLEEVISHIDGCEECQKQVESLAAVSHSSASATELKISKSLKRLEGLKEESSTKVLSRLLALPKPVGKQDGDVDAIPQQIGPYRIVRKIAEGGMGAVYEGRHINLGRTVAVKLLYRAKVATREQAEQVLAEWRAHGLLSHPNIATATDAGIVDGQPYLVMAYIDGWNLSAVVRSCGTLSLELACSIIRTIALAMQYAHSRGVYHLDIKPSNIMLDETGEPKLLDLGTAYLSAQRYRSTVQSDSTRPQFGTVGYIAPERRELGSNHLGDFDPQPADIYSLGCTLYFLVQGEIFDGNLSLVKAKHERSEKSVRMLRLLERMLAEDPTQRPRSMQEVADELEGSDNSELLGELSRQIRDNQPLDNESTGRTIQLTELMEQLQANCRPTSRTRRLVAMFSIALVAACGLWFIFSLARSQTITVLNSAESSTPAKLVEAKAEKPATLESTRWEWMPVKSQGILVNPAALFEKAKALQPELSDLVLDTQVSASPVEQLEWSPLGDQLALLDRRGGLRIFDWDGKRLTIQRIYDHANEPIQRFAWHRLKPMLTVASARSLATIDLSENPGWDSIAWMGEEPQDIQWACAGGQSRLLVLSHDGLSVVDPSSGTAISILEELSPEAMSVSPSGARIAVIGRFGLKIFELTFSEDECFARETAHNSQPAASPVMEISWSPKESLVAWAGFAVALVFRADDLSHIGTMDLRRMYKNHGGFDWVRSNREGVEDWEENLQLPMRLVLYSEGSSRIKQISRTISPESPEHRNGTIDRSAMLSGSLMASVVIDAHPTQNFSAIANGHFLGVWDEDFRPIYQVPGINPVQEVRAINSASAVFYPNGQMTWVHSNGEFDVPVPARTAQNFTEREIGRQEIWPERGYLVQTDVREDLYIPLVGNNIGSLQQWDVRCGPADLANISLEVWKQRSEQNYVGFQGWSTLFAVPPNGMGAIHKYGHPDGVSQPSDYCFDPASGMVVAYYGVEYLVFRDGRLLKSGKFSPETSVRKISLSHDAKQLFVVGRTEGALRVQAIDIETLDTQWSQQLKVPNRFYSLSAQAHGQLVVAHADGWATIDANSGSVLDQFDPSQRVGFAQERIAATAGGPLLSWSAEPRNALVGWNESFEPDWVHVGVLPAGAITLSSAGDVIAKTELAEPVVQGKIFIEKEPEFLSTVPPDPEEAFCIIQYLPDGAQKITPGVKVE